MAPSEPTVCPAIVDYTKADMAKAADEVQSLPTDAMLRRMITDYRDERAKLKACRAAG